MTVGFIVADGHFGAELSVVATFFRLSVGDRHSEACSVSVVDIQLATVGHRHGFWG
jgi:hypothetical protein